MNHFRTSRTKEAFLFKDATILTSFTVICPILGILLLWQNYGIYTMSKCRSMKVAQQMNNRMPIRKNG